MLEVVNYHWVVTLLGRAVTWVVLLLPGDFGVFTYYFKFCSLDKCLVPLGCHLVLKNDMFF